MAHWARFLPLGIHDVQYEELIRDQQPVSRALLAHCGLEWDERCLGFYRTRRAVRTASSVQVRRPLTPRSIGRWEHYQKHLQPLFAALGDATTVPSPSMGVSSAQA